MSGAGAAPARLLTMGRILGPFGVKGWVKIAPFTAVAGALCDYPKWWIGSGGDWREVNVEMVEAHADTVVAKLEGHDVRETVAQLKGLDVAVPREALPEAGADEVYWDDLVGLEVVNLQGEALGKITEVFSNGAHEVLRVSEPGRKDDRLLPYVGQVVREVNLTGARLLVDWGADW
jgi:16S rRNA processing protein RimM